MSMCQAQLAETVLAESSFSLHYLHMETPSSFKEYGSQKQPSQVWTLRGEDTAFATVFYPIHSYFQVQRNLY